MDCTEEGKMIQSRDEEGSIPKNDQRRDLAAFETSD